MIHLAPWLWFVGACGFMEPFNAGLFGTVRDTAADVGSDDDDAVGDDDDAVGDDDDAVGDDDDAVGDDDDVTAPDPCDDTDGDGVCDEVDDCPFDARDDSDGDGSCDSDDLCPGFDDNVDVDNDDIPNGCDVCPNDPANDPDGDGICEGVDPCPGDGSNTCPYTVELWLRCDDWPTEASWIFEYESGPVIDSRGFAQDYQVFNQTYPIPHGSRVCISVFDSWGDGGIDGEVTIVESGRIVGAWSETSYSSYLSNCFNVVP